MSWSFIFTKTQLPLCALLKLTGGVAEWFNAPVLKTDVLKGTGGSNPSSSATLLGWAAILAAFFI